jgi:haloalkane dehalogenase
MDLKRFVQVFTARWFVVVGMALVGLGAGVGLTWLRNRAVVPEVESTIQLAFSQGRNEATNDFNDRVDLAYQLAQQVADATDPTGSQLSTSQTTETSTGATEVVVISLSATGVSTREAEAAANQFKDDFLVEFSAGTTTRLEETVAELESLLLDLQEQREALNVRSPEQIRLDAERTALEQEIAAIQSNLSSLYIELYDPTPTGTPRSPEEIQAEIDRLVEDLGVSQADLAALGPDVDTGLQIQMDLLDAQINEIENQLIDAKQELITGVSSVANTPPDERAMESIVLITLASLPRAGGVGLLVGLLVGTGVVVGADRVRRAIWSSADIVHWPVFAEVTSARPHGLKDPWYLGAGDDSRKLGVQALRPWTEGPSLGRGIVVGLAGQATALAHIHDLAADLAVAIAVSDRSVLLVDTEFGNSTPFPELASSSTTVAELLSLEPSEEASPAEQIRSRLSEAPEALPRLTVLEAGTAKLSASDALAGRRFALLLAEAAKQFDVVLVTTSNVASALTSTFPRRLDQLIMVMTAGRSRVPDLERVALALRAHDIPSVGAVLLDGPERTALTRMFAPPAAPTVPWAASVPVEVLTPATAPALAASAVSTEPREPMARIKRVGTWLTGGPGENGHRTRRIEVLGKSMAYQEIGTGSPIVFVHGNPGSSYSWRNVLPSVTELGRCLVVDLMGMGDSEKLGEVPEAYSFEQHSKYLEAFLEVTRAVDDVTLVLHDVGSMLGFEWARRHPEAVKAIAYIDPITEPVDSSDLDPVHWQTLEALRSPTGGSWLLSTKDAVDTLLKATVSRPLDDETLREYRRSLSPGVSRLPVLAWYRQLPIDGEPHEMVAQVERYAAWMAQTRFPKLRIDANPGGFLAVRNGVNGSGWHNERMVTVAGGGMVLEDSPAAVGNALADWLESL